MASFVLYPELTTYWSPPLLSRVAQSTAEYLPEVRFADCAMGDDRVLATRYNWATFIRHDFEHVWFDEGSLDQQPSPAVWQQFGLLVFPAAPDDGANVLNFSLTKQNVAGYDVGAYAELRRRLPVLVELPDYDYQGGERLASCAEQFGYTAIRFG